MNVLEIKEILKSKIDKIENEQFLSEINTVFENTSKNFDSYNIDLQKSEVDIVNGNVYTHNQVLSKIEEWKKR